MKVWTNRVPTALVVEWGKRAETEGATGSAMLRHVMETALASTAPIMPASSAGSSDAATKQEPAGAIRETRNADHERPAPEDCTHPKAKRRALGYTTLCGVCLAPVRR